MQLAKYTTVHCTSSCMQAGHSRIIAKISDFAGALLVLFLRYCTMCCAVTFCTATFCTAVWSGEHTAKTNRSFYPQLWDKIKARYKPLYWTVVGLIVKEILNCNGMEKSTQHGWQMLRSRDEICKCTWKYIHKIYIHFGLPFLLLNAS